MAEAKDMQFEDAVAATYKELFKRKHRFMVVKINIEDSMIVVENTGARDATFEDFKAAIPKDEPRYAAYDLEFDVDERKVSKVIFMLFNPDTAKEPKHKFVYANYKDLCQKKMDNSAKTLSVHDHSDINEADWVDYF